MKTKISVSPIYKNNNAVKQFIETLPTFFDTEGTVLYNKRNIIKSFAIDDSDDILKSVVVKRYKHPSFVQRIVYSFFRKNKAVRAFRNAAELRSRKIDTPQEIAYIEEWKNGLFSNGYYISGSDYAPPIKDKFPNEGNFDHIMAEDFACFTVELHEKGILHHDLNSTNVLYHPNKDGHYHFSVIDINRMTIFSEAEKISPEKCFNNLTRFTGNMDLYVYVLKHYIEKRGWNKDTVLNKGLEIKLRHDEQRRRRKAILRKLKLKKE